MHEKTQVAKYKVQLLSKGGHRIDPIVVEATGTKEEQCGDNF